MNQLLPRDWAVQQRTRRGPLSLLSIMFTELPLFFCCFQILTQLVHAQNGTWGPLITFPLIPVAAYVVPEFPSPSRFLFFSSWGNDTFGGAAGKTQFGDYNWKSGVVSNREVSNTQHDMFCPGMSSLVDSRLVITGGSDANVVSLYHPGNNSFTRAPDMKIARGYQTSTTLSNGNVFTIGGSYSGPRGGKTGEVYDAKTNIWTLLPGTNVTSMLTVDHEGIWREDNHAWLFGWKNGSVFQAGPSKAMNWYGTSGTGTTTAAGIRDSANDAMCGINVMFDAGKILAAGGAQYYDDAAAIARAYYIEITEPNVSPKVTQLPSMRLGRAFANAVVLPDGKVLISGGQTWAHVFTDTDAVKNPELFDPSTSTFSVQPAEQLARNYHSVSLLLADGTVFSGGGGMCYLGGSGCNRAVDHPNGQIFTPPYLYKKDGTGLATRPVISGVGITSTDLTKMEIRVAPGASLWVSITGTAGITGYTFSLVRIGSVTHSINSDQRRLSLTVASRSGQVARLTLPSDPGVLLPGFYYLFVMNADGVPAVARTVAVQV